MNTRRLLILALLTAFAVACGAGQQPAAAPPSATQSEAHDAAAARQPAPGATTPTATTTPGASPFPSGLPTSPLTPTSRFVERERIVQELTLLQKGLDLSLNAGVRQCDLACRALTSMEKAVEKLCRMAQDDAEQKQCDDARGRLRDATTRVKTECGECAH